MNVRHSLMVVALVTGALYAKDPASKTAQPPSKTWIILPRGQVSSLNLEHGTLTVCDQIGGRQYALATQEKIPFKGRCPGDMGGNASCSDLPVKVDVRSNPDAPEDLIDVGGQTLRVAGRVHDCAAQGPYLGVASGTAAVLYRIQDGKSIQLSNISADRVAVGEGWVAWADTQGVHVKAIAHFFPTTMK